MKKHFIGMIFIMCIITILQAQKEYENNWILGLGREKGDTTNLFGGIRMNFSYKFVEADTFFLSSDDEIITTMSDEKGELIFYSNGCSIRNKLGQIMENGDTLNPGEVFDQYCTPELGNSYYPQNQLMISLPTPGHEGRYEVFHVGYDGKSSFASDFYQTSIDINANKGLGKVIKKNKKLFSKPKLDEVLSACRHGNGRDWWILLPSLKSDTFYRLLLTPNGTEGPYIQKLGFDKTKNGFSGQSAFSPNGHWYVQTTRTIGTNLFNFDPCTGLLSNAQRFYFAPDTTGCSGVAFSSNSRFLYVTSCTQLYQYDLWSSDIMSSRITIDDVVKNPKTEVLAIYQGKLALDDKIYFSTLPNWKNLHVVNQPNELGKACDFEQQGLLLPRFNGWYLPNIPYFRLYDQADSPCDTLGIDGPVATTKVNESKYLSLYPNPCKYNLTIEIPRNKLSSDISIDIINSTGTHILTQAIDQTGSKIELDISSWPIGMYVVLYKQRGKLLQSEKFVKD